MSKFVYKNVLFEAMLGLVAGYMDIETERLVLKLRYRISLIKKGTHFEFLF